MSRNHVGKKLEKLIDTKTKGTKQQTKTQYLDCDYFSAPADIASIKNFQFQDDCPTCAVLNKELTSLTKIYETPIVKDSEQYIFLLLSCAIKLNHSTLVKFLISYLRKNSKTLNLNVWEFLKMSIEGNNLEFFVFNLNFASIQGIFDLPKKEIVNSIYKTKNRTIFALFFSQVKSVPEILKKYPFDPKIESENYFYLKILESIRKNATMNNTWNDLQELVKIRSKPSIGILKLFFLQLKLNNFKILNVKNDHLKKYLFLITDTNERWVFIYQIIILILGKLPHTENCLLHETMLEFLNNHTINEISSEIRQKSNKIRKGIEEVFNLTYTCSTFFDNFKGDYDKVNFWKPLISVLWSYILGTGFWKRSGLFEERDDLKRLKEYVFLDEPLTYSDPELPFSFIVQSEIVEVISEGTYALSEILENNSVVTLSLNLKKFDRMIESIYSVERKLLVSIKKKHNIDRDDKFKYFLIDVKNFFRLKEVAYTNTLTEMEKKAIKNYKLQQTSKLSKLNKASKQTKPAKNLKQNKSGKLPKVNPVTNSSNNNEKEDEIQNIKFSGDVLKNGYNISKYFFFELMSNEIQTSQESSTEEMEKEHNKVLEFSKTKEWDDLLDYYKQQSNSTIQNWLTLDLRNYNDKIRQSHNWIPIRDGLEFYRERRKKRDFLELVDAYKFYLNGPRFLALQKQFHPLYIMLKYYAIVYSCDSYKQCKLHKDIVSLNKWERKARCFVESFVVQSVMTNIINKFEEDKLNKEVQTIRPKPIRSNDGSIANIENDCVSVELIEEDEDVQNLNSSSELDGAISSVSNIPDNKSKTNTTSITSISSNPSGGRNSKSKKKKRKKKIRTLDTLGNVETNITTKISNDGIMVCKSTSIIGNINSLSSLNPIKSINEMDSLRGFKDLNSFGDFDSLGSIDQMDEYSIPQIGLMTNKKHGSKTVRKNKYSHLESFTKNNGEDNFNTFSFKNSANYLDCLEDLPKLSEEQKHHSLTKSTKSLYNLKNNNTNKNYINKNKTTKNTTKNKSGDLDSELDFSKMNYEEIEARRKSNYDKLKKIMRIKPVDKKVNYQNPFHIDSICPNSLIKLGFTTNQERERILNGGLIKLTTYCAKETANYIKAGDYMMVYFRNDKLLCGPFNIKKLTIKETLNKEDLSNIEKHGVNDGDIVIIREQDKVETVVVEIEFEKSLKLYVKHCSITYMLQKAVKKLPSLEKLSDNHMVVIRAIFKDYKDGDLKSCLEEEPTKIDHDQVIQKLDQLIEENVKIVADAFNERENECENLENETPEQKEKRMVKFEKMLLKEKYSEIDHLKSKIKSHSPASFLFDINESIDKLYK